MTHFSIADVFSTCFAHFLRQTGIQTKFNNLLKANGSIRLKLRLWWNKDS